MTNVNEYMLTNYPHQFKAIGMGLFAQKSLHVPLRLEGADQKWFTDIPIRPKCLENVVMSKLFYDFDLVLYELFELGTHE